MRGRLFAGKSCTRYKEKKTNGMRFSGSFKGLFKEKSRALKITQ